MSVSTAVALAMFLSGLAIIAYPTVSDMWNRYNSVRMISAYDDTVDALGEERIAEMFADAEAYNATLSDTDTRFIMTGDARSTYNELLHVSDAGIMGYVTIPVISVNIPIYHGTSDEVLNKAVGHVEGSSLPVGGVGTHTVVSGHRGLPSARLFTDLNLLREGDRFSLTVLNRVCWYEIDQIRVVEPSDLSGLRIDAKADLATLITCTPYGVNTQRLLVRGHRVDGSGETEIEAEATLVPKYVVILSVGIPMLLLVFGFSVATRRLIGYNGYDKEAVMKELASMSRKGGEDDTQGETDGD